MDRTDALKEAITEEAFSREPLAMAIMLYLNQTDPTAPSKINDLFDGHMSNRLEQRIKEYLGQEEAD